VRKGQAAMEFLMTYGWAILVVLVAIGALAYFGVLSPGRFLPESCTIAPGLDCYDFGVDASANQIQMDIRNGMGQKVTFSAVNLDTDGDGTADCTEIAGGAILDGGTGNWDITCPDADVGASGENFKATIIGTYTKGTGTIPHGISGVISARITA